MADLRVTSNGKCFYKIDDGTAALLLELLPAAVERVNPQPKPKPAAPAPPMWGVGIDSGGHAFIAYTFGGQTTKYSGPPESAANGFKYRQWSGEKQAYIFDGPEPPAGVLEQYRQQFTGPAKSFLPAEYHLVARGSGEK